MQYQLGSEHTGQLLLLELANTTYEPQSDLIERQRASELRVFADATPACDGGPPEDCLQSIAVINQCAAELACALVLATRSLAASALAEAQSMHRSAFCGMCCPERLCGHGSSPRESSS